MRCIVQSCKNDSRHISKSEGITFHVFPTETLIREAWLKALGKEKWTPKERSAVCSDHFLYDDLYWTKNGLRKVKSGAIPIVLLETNDVDGQKSSSLRVCRICLATDVKLLSMSEYRLEQEYQYLTGLSMSEETFPRYLCMECAYRLLNFAKLRTKSLQAYSLMCEIVKKKQSLSMQSIKAINRESNQLSSQLTTKLFETNHADLRVEDNGVRQSDENQKTKLNTQLTTNIDRNNVKNELNTEIYLMDSEDYTQETRELKYEANENVQIYESVGLMDQDDKVEIADLKLGADENDERHEALGLTDKDESAENTEMKTDDVDRDFGVEMDEEFHVNDKDYSSDDSLVLEIHKSMKKKKKLSVSERKRGRKKQKPEPTQPKIDRRRKPFGDFNGTLLFTITELTKAEQLEELQKRKDSPNYKNSTLQCEHCFKGFLDIDAFNSHMMKHSKQSGEYVCDVCKTHFKHTRALRKHITAHHSHKYSCNQCNYVTNHRQTANLHGKWHNGTKYSCPQCQDEFIKFSTYMGHLRIKHPSDFVCQLCGYSFVSEKGIYLHKKLKHRVDNVEIPADGPYCEVCNIRFLSTKALEKHMSVSSKHATRSPERKNKNPNEYKYRRMARRMQEGASEQAADREGGGFVEHKAKSEGPLTCEQCGMQLEDCRAYHAHFRRMHPDKNRTKYPSMKSPCMCEICGKLFQSFSLLRDHTWIHTGERPFKCETCGKSFRMKQRLVTHRHIHSQTKVTFVCSVCGKNFSNQSNRQRHMAIHTGHKPFVCEMCGKAFKQASEKRSHVEYVHLKKPWPKRARAKRRQMETGARASETETAAAIAAAVAPPPQMWPGCDTKVDMNVLVDDKAIYYNLKI